MGYMLTICTDNLPQSCLSYLAFRVAFHETLERMALAQQIGDDGFQPYGFLTEVPFLRSVPPHVQLDLLAETWQKHMCSERIEATLVDESVVYAVCETSARLVETDPGVVKRFARSGPLDVEMAIDHFLASELRNLHLSLSNEGDFLLISQFEDLEPRESRRLKQQFNLDENRLEEMFHVLGHWYVSADLIDNFDGLLTHREILRAASVISGRSSKFAT